MTVKDRVIDALAAKTALNPQDIRIEQTFADLGLDSVALLEVLFALEEAYDIDITLGIDRAEDRAIDGTTVEKLINTVQAQVKAR